MKNNFFANQKAKLPGFFYKIFPILKVVLPVAFWLTVWAVAARIVNDDYFLPTIGQTMRELWVIIREDNFALTIISTLCRVLFGLLLGCASGVILATLSHLSSIFKCIVSPFISVVKSTPVATFIIILWIFMSGDALPVFIAFLMVMPIIWQNVLDGFGAIDKELSEVCKIYRFSFWKRLRVLIFPTILNYFIPAFITAAGLAWKSEIAAEIIAYTENSIGGNISDANTSFLTATVLAWSLIVITFSILLEVLTKFLLRRYKKNA